MNLRRAVVLLLAGMAWYSEAVAQTPRVLLGVLEDTPGTYAGEPHYRSVRAVFYKEAGEWQAFPSDCRDQMCLKSVTSKYPREVTWTIGFDGRVLGQATARTPDDFEFYGHIGQQKILGTSPVPTVGKPSEEYAGFLADAVYRPLVADSEAYFRDPESWKPSAAPDRILGQARRTFREMYPKLEDCQIEGKPAPYANKDIRLLKSYGSSHGWWLVRMGVSGCAAEDGPGGSRDEEWFIAAPSGAVSYLGSDMWLVDAGDYDNDGRSELVFAIDDYNRGGYKLFYEDFKRSVVFKFSYH